VLKAHGVSDGLYLLRESITKHGSYVISVYLYGKYVLHVLLLIGIQFKHIHVCGPNYCFYFHGFKLFG